MGGEGLKMKGPQTKHLHARQGCMRGSAIASSYLTVTSTDMFLSF